MKSQTQRSQNRLGKNFIEGLTLWTNLSDDNDWFFVQVSKRGIEAAISNHNLEIVLGQAWSMETNSLDSLSIDL